MELAECRARELAYRDEGGPRDEVCPRSGPVTQHPRRPTTMANTPELEGITKQDRTPGTFSYTDIPSVHSVLSAGSILSVGSAGSILSICSSGSILSIGSAGSILSFGSAGSILSVGSLCL